MKDCDVTVIGGGPAGLAAALAANEKGARVRLIEREGRLGGILKQCIHDGFGLIRFGEKLSGPEYVERFMDRFEKAGIESLLLTFVTDIQKEDDGFRLTVVNREGVSTFRSGAIILATGCRERTAKQVSIHGTRPAGVFTAGSAQNLVNLHGQMVTRRCVILGSGDIGLIMARRLTLEGAKVVGVYEIKAEPSGLMRNIVQCLHDYDIPLHLSHTVTRVFGHDRLTGVEVAQVGPDMKVIPGTEERIDCDALILSVGLIPENELAERLGVALDGRTKGPVCDERFMTKVPGVFACGNCLHVNDLVDYVSESGELAGAAAADYTAEAGHASEEGHGAEAGHGTSSVQATGADRRGSANRGGEAARNSAAKGRPHAEIEADRSLQYVVPQHIGLDDPEGLKNVVLYFRSSKTLTGGRLEIETGGKLLVQKKYRNLRPPEMEKLVVDFSGADLKEGGVVTMRILDEKKQEQKQKQEGGAAK